MIDGFFRVLIKVIVASLIVGTIMAHFGVTPDHLMSALGITEDRLIELAHGALTWALPNLLLGSLIIVPAWFVIYLLRPPRARSD